MNPPLRPYQIELRDFIVENPRCAVYLFMGGGKTLTTLAALDRVDLLEDAFPVLVLAPLRVARAVWPAEVERWFPHLDVSVICGDPGQRMRALRTNADVYTMNYENVPWLVKTLKGTWPFATVVADESTRLKSFRIGGDQGLRARALSKVAWHSDRFIELSGTPAPNGLLDLWGPTWFLDRGQRLGHSYTAYRDRWFRAERVGTDAHQIVYVPFPHTQAEVEGRIKDISRSYDPHDHFDLRDPITTVVRVDLPPDVMRIYREMEEDLYIKLHDVEAANGAVASQKCLQLTSGFLYKPDEDEDIIDLHQVKLDALESIIEEASGAPVLVAYHYKADLKRLLKRFPKGRHLSQDPRVILDWNAGKIPVLFAHPKSAGHGLNLQHGGNILVYFGHDWDLEARLQIAERIGPVRQIQAGFDRPVFIYHIVANGTIDEVVLARTDEKLSVVESLLEAFRHHEKP